MSQDWMRKSLDAIRAAKAMRGKSASGARTAQCAHLGCDIAIRSDSATGVCRDQMHKPECRCRQCIRQIRGRT